MLGVPGQQGDQIGQYIGLLKLLATFNLSKSPTFLGNFCKGVKIYHYSSEIIFRQNFIDIWRFSLVTLLDSQVVSHSTLNFECTIGVCYETEN